MMVNRVTVRAVAAAAVIGTGAFIAARVAARSRPAQDEPVGYPPYDQPKPVADDVWVVDSGPLKAGGLPVPIRMTIIRLPSDDLILHSPVPFTAQLADRVSELGVVRHLIAPNSAHWMFMAQWQQHYRDALAWAAPGLRNRAQVRRSNLRIDHDLGDEPPAAWKAQIAQGILYGAAGFREVYFFHRPSSTLILADLIQNLEPERLPPLAGAAARLARSTNATTPLHVRAVLRLGGGGAAAAANRMIALAPERVVFAHGRWFEADGASHLRRALAWLTGSKM